MSCPYFMTVSPVLMSLSAILWPIGTSILAVEPEGRIVVRDDAEHIGPGLQALDHDDADGVFRLVEQKLRGPHVSSSRLA